MEIMFPRRGQASPSTYRGARVTASTPCQRITTTGICIDLDDNFINPKFEVQSLNLKFSGVIPIPQFFMHEIAHGYIKRIILTKTTPNHLPIRLGELVPPTP